MGLFDSLFGSGKSKSKTESETTQTRTGTNTLESSSEGRTEQVGSSTTQLLRQDVQNELNDFLLGLIGRGADGEERDPTSQARELATFLIDRAKGAEEALNAQTTGILSEARRTGERELLRLRTDLAQVAGGSTGSAFVAGATAEGAAALESQLAALAANFAQQNRGVATEEFGLALSGLGAEQQQVAAISQLVNVLRGATSTTESRETGTASEQSKATETINEIIRSLTDSTTTTKDGSGLLGRIGKTVASFNS